MLTLTFCSSYGNTNILSPKVVSSQIIKYKDIHFLSFPNSTMSQSVLITGANRGILASFSLYRVSNEYLANFYLYAGIGKGLVKAYMSHPNTTVIAGVRDVNNPALSDLQGFPVASGSQLIVVKIDSISATDATAAVDELQSKYGVTQLDTVIANAGLGIHWDPIVEATASQAEENFAVNAVGPMRLFDATLKLLSAAPTPRFVVISSIFGSIEMQSTLQLPNVVYGMSKLPPISSHERSTMSMPT